jgi:hypothetical protein
MAQHVDRVAAEHDELVRVVHRTDDFEGARRANTNGFGAAEMVSTTCGVQALYPRTATVGRHRVTCPLCLELLDECWPPLRGDA